MRIFNFQTADYNWQTLRFVTKPPQSTPWDSVKNGPIAAEWVPPVMKPRDPRLPRSDFPMFLGRVLMISARAHQVLLNSLSSTCEFLPIDCKEVSYTGINVLQEIKALRRETSDITWISRKSGFASSIGKFDLQAELLENASIFRIPELPFDLFVSEGFSEMLYDNGLRGFSLRQVWTNE